MASALVDEYFARIEWRGASAPNLATLSSLLRAHAEAIPFENLDILLGRRVSLDLGALREKLLRARRGGYCFEHATLLAAVLEDLGFRVTRHSARVTLFRPADASPRTHMFLTVALPDGIFVVDPGFGGKAASFPIPLGDVSGHRPEGATHWMARIDGRWILRMAVDEGVIDAWVTTLERDHAVDFEMANHFTATHPASPFGHWLMMSILRAQGRVTVLNRDVAIETGEGLCKKILRDRAELRRLLVDCFGFDLPEIESLRFPEIPEWG